MKKIIHVDADCFYAAVEIRENNKLAGVPVAVGGDASRRGVIATCNYVARRYGVHSAMASAHAKKLCPELQIIKPNFPLYREASLQMFKIFQDFTDLVEPLSLDEAFLDVSGSGEFAGSATLLAGEIKRRVLQEVGISVSAGVAPVKFLAKIASDWRKPDGLFTIAPDAVSNFVAALPLKKLPGVGPATLVKLEKVGLYTCEDVQNCELERLKPFGAFAQRLVSMSRGEDESSVLPRQGRKSLSVEQTYSQDLDGAQQLHTELLNLLATLEVRLQPLMPDYRVSGKFIKLKFNDFSQSSAELRVDVGAKRESQGLSHGEFIQLLEGLRAKGTLPVRLIGVGVRLQQVKVGGRQLHLPFDGGGIPLV